MNQERSFFLALMAVVYLTSSGVPHVVLREGVAGSTFSKNLQAAKKFLEEYDKNATDISRRNSEANWAYETDLSESNLEAVVRLSLEESQFSLAARRRAGAITQSHLPADLLRQIYFIRHTADPSSKAMRKEIRETIGQMESIYSKGAIVKTRADGVKKSYPLQPDLVDIMKTSRNPRKLRWAWRGWRDAVGPPTRSLFEKTVNLLNEGARERGWLDYGDYLRSEYEMGDGFQVSLHNVLSAIEPLYKELHAYVRHKLMIKYGSQIVKPDGCIPAHLLGDMYAQNWENIFDIVKPKHNSKAFDITNRLKELNYTVEKIVSDAENFFTSIKLDAMPASFWKWSVFRKIPGKDMVCHASAWDFSTASDVRIKMCMEVNQEHYTTVHHEMGHLEYFLAYKDQPYPFRTGANPGFHEAIGDTVSLSVETPTYLYEKKLLKSKELSTDDQISFLLNQALRRLAPIPYNYLVDIWRWRVFDGNISASTYNQEWWKLRVKHQGVEPPTKRPVNAFDPASKYHIGANVPYIAYFVSYVLQFQLHKALCKQTGFQGPLYLCSIYGSKEAGNKLKSMLRAGRSKPWQQILEASTGDRQLSADAILEYFQPLRQWLEKKRNKEKYAIGWNEGTTKAVLRKKSTLVELGKGRSGILKTSGGDLSLSINIPAITFGSLGLESPKKNKSEYSEGSNETESSLGSSTVESSPTGVIDLAKLLTQGNTLSIKSSEMSAVSKGGNAEYDNKQVNIETERASASANSESGSMANNTATEREGEYTKGNKLHHSSQQGDASRQHQVGIKTNSTRFYPKPSLSAPPDAEDKESDPQSALTEKQQQEADEERNPQGQATRYQNKNATSDAAGENQVAREDNNDEPDLKESAKASKSRPASDESLALPIGTPGEPMRIVPISIPESLLRAIAAQAAQVAANKSLHSQKLRKTASYKTPANRTKSHGVENPVDLANSPDGAETAKDVAGGSKTGESDATTSASVLPCKRYPDGECLIGKVVKESSGVPGLEDEANDGSSKATVSVSPSLLIQKLLEHQSAASSAPEPVVNEVKGGINKTAVAATDDAALQANKKSSKSGDSDSKSMPLSDSDIGSIVRALSTSSENAKSIKEKTSKLCKRGVSLFIGCDDAASIDPNGASLSLTPAEIIQRLLNSRKQAPNRGNLPQASLAKTPNGFQLNFDLSPRDQVPADVSASSENLLVLQQQPVDGHISPKGMVLKPNSSLQLMKPSFVPVQLADNLELKAKNKFR